MSPLPNAEAALCGLFDAVGRADFASRLLRAVSAVAPVDYVSAFAFDLAALDRPLLIGTDSAAGPLPARHAAEHYVGDFWRDDPNMDLISGWHREEARSASTYLRAADIPKLSYRAACYDRPQILDRLSLLAASGRGGAVSVSFYRARWRGTFTPAERGEVEAITPFIRAAVLRHVELPSAGGTNPPAMLPRVRSHWPDLSRREAEVLAGVLCGLTAGLTAEWLSIAESSVVTHRKRAYRRLNIDGQRALIIAFHGH